MRILTVTPYSEPEGGGLERYAHALDAGLARRGHEVEAMAFTRGVPGSAVRDGVPVALARPALVAGNTPIGPRFAADVRRTIRRLRPDVVFVHTPVPFPAQAAAAAARREGVPYVVAYHAGLLRGSSPALGAVAALDRWTLERRMVSGAAALIAVSPYVRDNALRRHRDKVTVIPPGVDTAAFAPRGRPEPASVLFVGPLSSSYRWKGVDDLWEAFGHVRRARPEARLRLVGTGDRQAEFAAKARAARGAVELLGRVPAKELPRSYAASTVTVLPSRTDSESFGMVLAEANACGRPVVGSRVGGIPDFVRDGDNGLLSRPRNARNLADRILEVLEAPREARAMGQRGRRRVVREHDWGDLTRRAEAVLETAARSR